MELLAVAAIASWGYYSSLNGRAKPRKRRASSPEYADIVDDTQDAMPTELIRQYTDDAETRWNESRMPKVEGIITPYTRPSEIMPFYTSGKTQNTNTQYKQRKMDLFTGNLLEGTSATGTWKSKEEIPNMFYPTAQGVVTSGGTVGNPAGQADIEKIRTMQSSRQNNVVPAEQIRVGPGLAVGPEVASTGGFQQFYRQLPLNVNEYRLTQLPGRTNHPASRVEKAEAQQIQQVNHHPDALVLSLEDRPPEPTTGAFLGKTIYPEEPREYSGLKPFENDYFGIRGETTIKARQAPYSDDTRGKLRHLESDDRSYPVINPEMERSGTGAYFASTDTSLKPTSQREQTDRFTTGPVAAIEARQAPLRDDVRPTLRQSQTRGLTNPGTRMNVFEPGHQGKMTARHYPYYDAGKHAFKKLPNPVFTGTEGVPVRTGSKKVLTNPWIESDVVQAQKRQFSDNRYAHDVACGSAGSRPLPQQRFAPKPWKKRSSGPRQYPPWANRDA